MGKSDAKGDLRNRTKQFAIRIIRLYCALPQNNLAQILGKQILRSGTSLGAHYREASRARSDAEFISKIQVGLQELDETAYWMELLVESGTLKANQSAELEKETQELIAIFSSIVIKVKKRKSD